MFLRAIAFALVAHFAAQTMTPLSLRAELLRPRQLPGLAERVTQFFGEPALIDGSGVKKNGLDIAWAVQALRASQPPQVVREDGAPPITMKRIGETDIYAAGIDVPDGTGFRWRFMEAGQPIGDWHNLEAYNPNPGNQENSDIPHGVTTQQPKWTSKLYDKVTFDWWVYVPAGAKADFELPVMIFQDGAGPKSYAPTTLDNLIAAKQIPSMAAVFISPGVTAEGKSDRSREYDTLSETYSKFLLEEILPQVEKIQKLKHDPASRAISGASSGGICAFTAAWEHPEAFGKVLSWVGSFTDIAHGDTLKEGGHNYPYMIRLTDKKPIRVLLQDGYNDLDNQFGNWWLANQAMAAALKFKSYDYLFVGGQGFHSDLHGRAILPESLKWLWRP